MWFVMTPENRTLVYELSCHGLYVWYPIAFSVKITSLIWWNLGYLCVFLFSSNTMKFFLKDNIYSRLFYVSILEWRRVWLKTESCGGGRSPLLPQFLYGSLVNIERPIMGWIGIFHTFALTKQTFRNMHDVGRGSPLVFLVISLYSDTTLWECR